MPSSDYHRIEQAIHYLDANTSHQPSLADVAGHLGLSVHHCHRLFHRWAGVTPKDFLQVATLRHAKALLAQSRPVLDAALEAGLSGPGRLHDLFVTMESMTPGEYRRAAEGLIIRWGVHDTPIGPALIALADRGICAFYFLDSDLDPTLLLKPYYRARLRRDNAAVASIAAEVSSRMLGHHREPLSVVFRGTPFQVKVWQALLAIPPGAVTSYGEVAARIGHPTAHRAVASAIGANEVSYLIPCHRVLRATGALGGYRWGIARKRALLGLETLTSNPKSTESESHGLPPIQNERGASPS